MILLSHMTGKNKEANSVNDDKQSTHAKISIAEYDTELEKRLTKMLERMNGVGEAIVTVSISGTEKHVYAEEVKSSKSDHSQQQETRIVTTKSNGQETPLVSQISCPSVTGVAVLCGGGDHAWVREAVTEAIGTVLCIPPSRIYVGKTA